MGKFERFLTWWVLLCIAVGIGFGKMAPRLTERLAEMEYHGVNLPLAVLIWLMIYPMMVKVDFGALRRVGENAKGLALTVGVNWLIKPFTMALIAWFFFKVVFAALIPDAAADEYLAGAILLGVAPCTAMVFVWSHLSDGNPNYTLTQVAVNDLILLFAFVPISGFLMGVTDIAVPSDVLVASVVVYVMLPLVAGWLTRWLFLRTGTPEDLEKKFFNPMRPVTIVALLLTLVLLFAFQGETIVEKPLVIALIAVPLIIQTYLIFAITWKIGRWWKLPYPVCAPGAMIGASNFFELAVAVAIALFGVNSGAALATVVGVLIEVPVMLSLVRFANKNRF
jgi:arsenite transporter